jgi:hypothetical protein
MIEDPEMHKFLHIRGACLEEKILLREEEKAIYYLSRLRTEVAIKTIYKPPTEVVLRALNRQLLFLDKIYKVTEKTYKDKSKNKIAIKRYKACKYYLFKFTLKAWVDSLPEYIEGLKNK